MAARPKIRMPRLPGVALWACVSGLLALGLLTTMLDLAKLPDSETRYANEHRQRFMVNPGSGEVILAGGMDPEGKPLDAFDVGTATDVAAPVTPEVKEEPALPKEEVLPEGIPALRTTPLAQGPATTPEQSKVSLVPAPAPEVTETVDGMKLPKRGEKDAKPSELYAQPFKRTPEQALLSFVVIDAGMDPQSIGLLMALPKEVTVAYSPYARNNATYSENLRTLGHEVWTMLPTMTTRYPNDDPGPLGLISGMPKEEIARRMQHALATVPGSIGMVLSPEESFAQQKGAMAPALAELNARGLLLLSTHANRTVEQITTDATLTPIVHRADLLLDPEANESQIRSKLAGIVASAKEKGEYMVVLSARPQTLELLGQWLKDTTLSEPVVLAPASGLYQPKTPVIAAEPAAEEGGHGGGEKKKDKPKPPPPKKQKELPQDKYLKPAKAEGGEHH